MMLISAPRAQIHGSFAHHNGHNARIMHDHVTVIGLTLITIVVHQNFRLLVTLASFIQPRAVVCSYRVFEPPFSLFYTR